MKLALASSDFEENTITFLVPEAVMLDMGFYPCELEVGVEELMKHPPKKAEPAPTAPSEEETPTTKQVEDALAMSADIVRREPWQASPHSCHAILAAALRSQLAQATNNAQFWMGENSKTTRYYEAQLARKDEGLRMALEEAAQSLEALAGLAGKDETMLEYDQVRGYALNRAMAARAALREPDGRKGE